LDTLRDQGLEHDTIVVFTTDHGEMLGSHRLISKDIFYEESVKTPMIVRQPGKILPGKVNDDALVGTIDLIQQFWIYADCQYRMVWMAKASRNTVIVKKSMISQNCLQ
jgi:hypothetical protein